MPDTPEQLLNLVFDENSPLAIEFYQAYGRALSAWARIETNLGYQFHSITNTRIEIALPVFYSARNFNAFATGQTINMEQCTISKTDRSCRVTSDEGVRLELPASFRVASTDL